MDQIIQLKISLDGIKPPIWRRFVVPDSISLHRLHTVIQTVMGWDDYHLYSFEIADAEYHLPNKELDDGFDLLGTRPRPKNSQKTKLWELNLNPGRKFKYTYDFGDNWRHTITVEKVLAPDSGAKAPWCLDGRRKCPPEDCGSISGYEHIIEILKNGPKTKDDKDLLDWLGEGYDPEYFDPADVNLCFIPKKRKMPKKISWGR